MKFGLKKVIMASFLFMMLVPTIFGIQQGSIEEITESRCDALESYEDSDREIVNISEHRIVRLNGEDVDQVNCSEIDSYEFGLDSEGVTDNLKGPPTSFYIILLSIPVGFVVLLSGLLKNKGYFEWREIIKIFASSISVMILIVFSILIIPGSSFMLYLSSGCIISVSFTTLRLRNKNSDYKIGALTALFFYIQYIILFSFLINF